MSIAEKFKEREEKKGKDTFQDRSPNMFLAEGDLGRLRPYAFGSSLRNPGSGPRDPDGTETVVCLGLVDLLAMAGPDCSVSRQKLIIPTGQGLSLAPHLHSAPFAP